MKEILDIVAAREALRTEGRGALLATVVRAGGRRLARSVSGGCLWATSSREPNGAPAAFLSEGAADIDTPEDRRRLLLRSTTSKW